jgi:hypothetical protein
MSNAKFRVKDCRQGTYGHERNVGISIIIQNNEVAFCRIFSSLSILSTV